VCSADARPRAAGRRAWSRCAAFPVWLESTSSTSDQKSATRRAAARVDLAARKLVHHAAFLVPSFHHGSGSRRAPKPGWHRATTGEHAPGIGARRRRHWADVRLASRSAQNAGMSRHSMTQEVRLGPLLRNREEEHPLAGADFNLSGASRPNSEAHPRPRQVVPLLSDAARGRRRVSLRKRGGHGQQAYKRQFIRSCGGPYKDV